MMPFVFATMSKAQNAPSFSSDSTRRELFELLKERKELFSQYSQSLEKKSGFFGNRTKNDMKASEIKLTDIVTIDNRIMNALNRSLEFKNFEKVNMRYDVNQYEERVKSLQVLNDTLSRRIDIYEEENKILLAKIRKNNIYLFLLITILVLMAGNTIRKKIRS